MQDGRIAGFDPADAPADAIEIDANGRTVAPGFIDAHMHLITGGLGLRDLDLCQATSPAEFQELIAQRHEQLPNGQWLIARNWSAESWGGSPQPDKSWLAAAGERPVVCYRMDLHAALVNDAVLQQCAMDDHDPPGGCMVRRADGEPTGLMIEAALWKLVNPLVPEPDAAAKQDALLAAQKHCHAMGITSVGTMEYAREVRDVLLPCADELTLRCAVTLLDRGWPMDCSAARKLADASHGKLSIIGCKAFADGTLGLRTARMLEDYADEPGNRGMLVEIAAEGNLRKWAIEVAQAGFSPAIHAIGDEAVRLALDAYEGLPASAQPRIEHAQQIHEDDINRFAQVIASMQPLHKADDGRYAVHRLGKKRMRGFFPFRQLLERGASIAFGSDWPVVTCDPVAGMRAAITGLTLDGQTVRPEENLSVEEALRAYTSAAAHALHMENIGVIADGAPADLVMFDLDPFTANWAAQPPKVVMTIAGGRIVHNVLSAPAMAEA